MELLAYVVPEYDQCALVTLLRASSFSTCTNILELMCVFCGGLEGFVWPCRGMPLNRGTHGTKILIAGIVYCYTSE